MKRVLLCLPLLLSACGEDPVANNQPRIVDQDALHNPIVPLEHVDSAVHTEAMGHMNLIYKQVNLKASLGGDTAAFYRSISGQVTSNTLSKLGLSEAHFQGTYYKASDYTITIVGKTMTIHAAQIGSRGRVDPQEFRVP